jgi:hypothetical protein
MPVRSFGLRAVDIDCIRFLRLVARVPCAFLHFEPAAAEAAGIDDPLAQAVRTRANHYDGERNLCERGAIRQKNLEEAATPA